MLMFLILYSGYRKGMVGNRKPTLALRRPQAVVRAGRWRFSIPTIPITLYTNTNIQKHKHTNLIKFYFPQRACITSDPIVSFSIFTGFCFSLLVNKGTPDWLYTVAFTSVHVLSGRLISTV